MAEEETFTFVDKRRAAAETAPETAADAAPRTEAEAPMPVADTETDAIVDEESDPLADDMGEDTREAPDVYQLLQYMTSLLATEAWHKMGLIANPATGEAIADLPQAKVAIDVVADLVTHLEKAPETILPPNGRRELRNLLNDLRLNYVAQRDRDKA